MRIRLNLATRPYADLGPALKALRIAMGVLILLCGLLWLGVRAFHQRAEEARARERTVDRKIAQIQRERQGYQDLMQQPENALVLKQATTLNALFDEKGFSWTLAMEDLETVLPGGVQATTLEPQRNPKDGHITLRLRVAGPRDRAVDLVRNLEHSRRFLLPRIVSEGAESAGGANAQQLEPVSATNRFSFDLLADYNPAPPGERRAEKKPQAGSVPAARPATRPAPAAVIPMGKPPARVPYTGQAQPRRPQMPMPVQPQQGVGPETPRRIPPPSTPPSGQGGPQ
ncbi:MAG: fimbrial assembly protein [Terracidiphilus sp.]